MANTIRITRSTTTNTPSTLAQGEIAYSEDGSPNGEGELFIGTAGAAITKIATTVLTGTDGVAAQPNASAQDNQVITTGLGIDGADAGDATAITISLASTELATTALAGTDHLVFDDATDNLPKKALLSGINLSLFNDDLGHVENVSTTLTAGTITATTYGITSDGSANDIVLPEANTTQAGLLGADKWDEIVANSLKTTNATHTGEVQGSGVLSLDVTAITNQAATAGITATDTIVMNDGGALAEATFTQMVTFFDANLTFGAVDSITSGIGIVDTGTAADPILALDFSELTDMVASISGTTEFILQNGAVESRKTANEIGLQFFDNATSEFVSENDSIVVVDWNWVLDEDAMGSDSAVHVPTQQSVKAYVDSVVTGGMTHKGGYNASTNTPTLDTGSPVLSLGDMYTVTVAGTFFTEAVEVGDVLISDVDSVDAAALADWTIVQNNLGAATETVPGYIQLATQTEMNTATNDTKAVTPLKYANSTIDGGTF